MCYYQFKKYNNNSITINIKYKIKNKLVFKNKLLLIKT